MEEATFMTLHVSLPQELEAMVHREVSSGMYNSVSEVVWEALNNFFNDSVSWQQLRDISELRGEMQHRRSKVLSGNVELIDGEEAFTKLAVKYGLGE